MKKDEMEEGLRLLTQVAQIEYQLKWLRQPQGSVQIKLVDTSKAHDSSTAVYYSEESMRRAYTRWTEECKMRHAACLRRLAQLGVTHSHQPF